MEIAEGETIAIVGENGAGKSTLVRLLTGIYRPSEGKVFIGGLDTAVASPASVYKGVSGVFQKYQRYKMTLKENVAISDVSAEAGAEKIHSVLSEADFEMGDIKLDDMLSPEFGGIDLSGGQWQRIALARALMGDRPVLILDEPTSQLDPMAESELYSEFAKLAENKTSLFITHRLGSTRITDRILVISEGRVVDTGTHEELLERGGIYADMWKAQKQWYI